MIQIDEEWTEDYTPDELAAWAVLLIKRSGHRQSEELARADMKDAAAYMSDLRERCYSGDTLSVFGDEMTLAELEMQCHEAWSNMAIGG